MNKSSLCLLFHRKMGCTTCYASRSLAVNGAGCQSGVCKTFRVLEKTNPFLLLARRLQCLPSPRPVMHTICRHIHNPLVLSFIPTCLVTQTVRFSRHSRCHGNSSTLLHYSNSSRLLTSDLGQITALCSRH